jgi:hypothetical protein
VDLTNGKAEADRLKAAPTKTEGFRGPGYERRRKDGKQKRRAKAGPSELGMTINSSGKGHSKGQSGGKRNAMANARAKKMLGERAKWFVIDGGVSL